MFQKIANALSIISFLMVASMSGTAYFAYKYFSSEQFKTKMINEVLGSMKPNIEKNIDLQMPKTTGEALPIPPRI